MLAEPYLMLPGTNGKLYVLSQRMQSPRRLYGAHLAVAWPSHSVRMSESIHDMEAYVHLHDGVFWGIEVSTDPKLAAARALLKVRAQASLA